VDLRVRAVREPVSVMSSEEETGANTRPTFTLFCCLVQRVESRPAEMPGGSFFWGGEGAVLEELGRPRIDRLLHFRRYPAVTFGSDHPPPCALAVAPR
jgi:hypothetical protein